MSDFLLTAEEFGAQQAYRIGLVQEVVPKGEHVTRARAIAQLIAKQAASATMGAGRSGSWSSATVMSAPAGTDKR